MRKIDALLNEYGVSHQTKLNIAIHYICVPVIFLSLIGLLASIPVPEAITGMLPASLAPFEHFGTIVIILCLIYYLRLSLVLFFNMLVHSARALFAILQIHLLQKTRLRNNMVEIVPII